MRRDPSLRYKQLSEEQRALIANGNDSVVIAPQLHAYLGKSENLPFFKKALEDVKRDFAGLACANDFIAAFVLWSNGTKRNSKRTFSHSQSLLANGWVSYLRDRKKADLSTSEVTRETLNDYLDWLKRREKNGEKYARETQRRMYGAVVALLKEMQGNATLKKKLATGLSFPNRAFRHGGVENPTELLDDVELAALLRACWSDVSQTMTEFWLRYPVVSGDRPCPPDETQQGMRRYADLDSCLWALRQKFDAALPNLEDLKFVDVDLANAVLYIHGYDAVSLPFYPTTERILPFVLLQAVFTSANTGTLLGLRLDNVTEKEVMGVLRKVFNLVKPRARTQYQRSFAIDQEDPFSPGEIHDFVLAWTSRIRSHAGMFSNNVFIFVTREKKIRGFLTADQCGAACDPVWGQSLRRFCERHNLPKLNIGNIRVTGLDIVRVLSDDDIRAVKAAGGQKSEQVIHEHYEGAGTRRRRHEALVEVIITREGWVFTKGRADPRGAPKFADLLAATPGWHCLDPFDSPIPGETRGRRCQAFGQCPACPLAAVNVNSSYSLARLLQLLDEINVAIEYLEPERWNAAYALPKKKLAEIWLPSFKDEKVIEAAALMSLNPIGRLE